MKAKVAKKCGLYKNPNLGPTLGPDLESLDKRSYVVMGACGLGFFGFGECGYLLLGRTNDTRVFMVVAINRDHGSCTRWVYLGPVTLPSNRDSLGMNSPDIWRSCAGVVQHVELSSHRAEIYRKPGCRPSVLLPRLL